MNLTGALPFQQALLAAFAQYAETAAEPNLADFGQWLAAQAPEAKPVAAVAAADAFDPGALATELQQRGHAIHFPYYRFLPPREQVMALLHRLARFQRMLLRGHFADLPLQSAEEYGLLAGFSGPDPPAWRKSALIQSALLDLPTGTEMVRRLLKQDLLTETPDPGDRRVRLLRITGAGRSVLEAANQRIAATATELTAALDEAQVQRMLPLLLALNRELTENLGR